MSSLLAGQEAISLDAPSPKPPALRLRLRQSSQSPQEVLRTMVALDQARKNQPGATVDVIGYDDDAALRLMALKVAEKTRLEFRNTDKLQAWELYEFMHQDPSHPSPVLFVPMLAGGKVTRVEDKWLR